VPPPPKLPKPFYYVCLVIGAILLAIGLYQEFVKDSDSIWLTGGLAGGGAVLVTISILMLFLPPDR
jgi:hypothetical protein